MSALSAATGISDDDLKTIWADVKANHAKLRSCDRHLFAGPIIPFSRERPVCLKCGGWMSRTDVSTYIKGYVAAGKPADDICPSEVII